MITTCLYCDGVYWRYRRDHPPTGFCSVPCHDGWLQEREARTQSSDGPGIPAAVLQLILSHRRITHGTDSVLEWFPCDECERLEELYARSLEWHYATGTAAIARETPMATTQLSHPGLTPTPRTQQKGETAC